MATNATTYVLQMTPELQKLNFELKTYFVILIKKYHNNKIKVKKFNFKVLKFFSVNPLNAKFTKWSNTLKVVSVCLTILWDWRLKG